MFQTLYECCIKVQSYLKAQKVLRGDYIVKKSKFNYFVRGEWGRGEVELIVNSIIFFNRLEGYSTYELWLVLSTNMKQKIILTL